MEFVMIGDDEIENKKFNEVGEYEKAIVSLVTRGFNLIFGNIKDRIFKYFRNENNELPTMSEPVNIKAGVFYGMSNGQLDQWDKVQRGKESFQDLYEQYSETASKLSCQKDFDISMNKWTKELFGVLRDE